MSNVIRFTRGGNMFTRAPWCVALGILVLAVVTPVAGQAPTSGTIRVQVLGNAWVESGRANGERSGSVKGAAELRDPVSSSEIAARGMVEMTGEVLDRFIKGIEAERQAIARAAEGMPADPAQAAAAASGLDASAYAQMKERLVIFIVARRLHPEITHKVASGSHIFSSVEIWAVTQRFARLEQLLASELPAPKQPTGS
jgi:hypothetical protein